MLSAPLDRFLTLDADRLLADLVTTRQGLTSPEADERLQTAGRNVAVETARRRILAKLAKRPREPLIAILIVAACLSGAMGNQASTAINFVLLVLLAHLAFGRPVLIAGEPLKGLATKRQPGAPASRGRP